MEEYDYISTLGEGAYGYVWKCQERSTGRVVAIKGFKQAHEEPEIMRLAVREVRVLQSLEHPAVIELIEAFKSKSGRVYMVFPYIGRSAYQELDRNPGGIPAGQLKLLVWQLLQALLYLHSRKIVHRDIKPANILMSEAGDVKLCDFGFARNTRCGPRDAQQLSTYVVTRWYRAPEVLVSDLYGPASDIWSLGCTVAELASGQPLFPGKSTPDQVWRIVRCFGPLAPGHNARVESDPRFAEAVDAGQGRTLRDRVPSCEPGLFRLLEACLQVDPAKRPVASELLQMPYFWSVPKLLAGTHLEEVYAPVLDCDKDGHDQVGVGGAQATTPAPLTKQQKLQQEQQKQQREGQGAAARQEDQRRPQPPPPLSHLQGAAQPRPPPQRPQQTDEVESTRSPMARPGGFAERCTKLASSYASSGAAAAVAATAAAVLPPMPSTPAASAPEQRLPGPQDADKPTASDSESGAGSNSSLLPMSPEDIGSPCASDVTDDGRGSRGNRQGEEGGIGTSGPLPASQAMAGLGGDASGGLGIGGSSTAAMDLAQKVRLAQAQRRAAAAGQAEVQPPQQQQAPAASAQEGAEGTERTTGQRLQGPMPPPSAIGAAAEAEGSDTAAAAARLEASVVVRQNPQLHPQQPQSQWPPQEVVAVGTGAGSAAGAAAANTVPALVDPDTSAALASSGLMVEASDSCLLGVDPGTGTNAGSLGARKATCGASPVSLAQLLELSDSHDPETLMGIINPAFLPGDGSAEIGFLDPGTQRAGQDDTTTVATAAAATVTAAAAAAAVSARPFPRPVLAPHLAHPATAQSQPQVHLPDLDLQPLTAQARAPRIVSAAARGPDRAEDARPAPPAAEAMVEDQSGAGTQVPPVAQQQQKLRDVPSAPVAAAAVAPPPGQGSGSRPVRAPSVPVPPPGAQPVQPSPFRAWPMAAATAAAGGSASVERSLPMAAVAAAPAAAGGGGERAGSCAVLVGGGASVGASIISPISGTVGVSALAGTSGSVQPCIVSPLEPAISARRARGLAASLQPLPPAPAPPNHHPPWLPSLPQPSLQASPRPASQLASLSSTAQWLPEASVGSLVSNDRPPSYILTSFGGGGGGGAGSALNTIHSGYLACCDTVVFDDCSTTPSGKLARLRAGPPAPNLRRPSDDTFPYSYFLLSNVSYAGGPANGGGGLGVGGDSGPAPVCVTPDSAPPVRPGVAPLGAAAAEPSVAPVLVPVQSHPRTRLAAAVAATVGRLTSRGASGAAGGGASASHVAPLTSNDYDDTGAGPPKACALSSCGVTATGGPHWHDGGSGGFTTGASGVKAFVTGRRSQQYPRTGGLTGTGPGTGTGADSPTGGALLLPAMKSSKSLSRSARLTQALGQVTYQQQQQEMMTMAGRTSSSHQQPQLLPHILAAASASVGGRQLPRPTSGSWMRDGAQTATMTATAMAAPQVHQRRQTVSYVSTSSMSRMMSLPERGHVGGDAEGEGDDEEMDLDLDGVTSPASHAAAAAAAMASRGPRGRSMARSASRAAAAGVGGGSSATVVHTIVARSSASAATSVDDWTYGGEAAGSDGDLAGGSAAAGTDAIYGRSIGARSRSTPRSRGAAANGQVSRAVNVLGGGTTSKVVPAPSAASRSRSRFSLPRNRAVSGNGELAGSPAPDGAVAAASRAGPGPRAVTSTSTSPWVAPPPPGCPDSFSEAVAAVGDVPTEGPLAAGAASKRRHREKFPTVDGFVTGMGVEALVGPGAAVVASRRLETKKGPKKGALSKIFGAVKKAFAMNDEADVTEGR